MLHGAITNYLLLVASPLVPLIAALKLLPQTASTTTDLSTSTNALASRALFVSSGLTILLSKATLSAPIDLTSLSSKLVDYEELKNNKATIVELTKARDKAKSDAHRAQRKLDKLAAGLPVEEIMRDIETAGGKNEGEEKGRGSASASPVPGQQTKTSSTVGSKVEAGKFEEVEKISQHRKVKVEELEQQVQALQKKLNDAASSATTTTTTSNNALPEHQVRSHPLFSSQSGLLATANGKLKMAESNIELLRGKCGSIAGKLNLAEQALRDLTSLSSIHTSDLLATSNKKCKELEGYLAKYKFKLSQALEGGATVKSAKEGMKEMKTLIETLTRQNEKLQVRRQARNEIVSSDYDVQDTPTT